MCFEKIIYIFVLTECTLSLIAILTMKEKRCYTRHINRTLSFKSSDNANFIDNRPTAVMQAKMIKQINESGIIQCYRAVPIHERNGKLMSSDVFDLHKSNAETYFNHAKQRMRVLNYQDKIFYPKTVACHDTTFSVCGQGPHANGRHAEIQILDDCPVQDCFEIGITQDMCTGQYGPPSCQETVTNNYENKKAIFAQVPGHLYIFPIGRKVRQEISEEDKGECCEKCESNLAVDKDSGLCENCIFEIIKASEEEEQRMIEEAQRMEAEEQMEHDFMILEELEEDERRAELEQRMQDYSEIPTYEHKCECCGENYESYDDSDSDSGWCPDCLK